MSSHVFAEIPKIDIPRSLFKRNHNLKTTMPVDYLIPIYVDEALPGDTFKLKQHLFGRLSTPIVPIMDNLYLDTFYFAVPLRLIDKDWVKFMGERPFGEITSVYSVPTLSSGSGGVSVQSLSDYLGIPIGVPDLEFCAHWHRAYNLIYNEWFRDENLCTPASIAGVSYDGTTHTEVLSDYVLRRRGKRHDYFTSALPWPQKGDGVKISVGDSAKVYGDGNALRFHNGAHGIFLRQPATNVTNGTVTAVVNGNRHDMGEAVANGNTNFEGVTNGALGIMTHTQLNNSSSGLIADLSSANPLTINALREAFAVQSLLEVDARSGTRYIEIIKGHFGITSPDARMQRPEYLGGTSEPLSVTSVPQTSSTDTTSPQGTLAAFVTARNHSFWSKSFTEHCVILGLASVRADLSYQQGLPRMFSRKTRYEYYWPELANLGEQAILNKEIYAQGTSADDDVFGYQERWAEYRYHPNMITGKFRSTSSGTLDFWHLAQKFDSLPTLSSQFIEEHVPIDRVVAVSDEPPIILDGYFEVDCARPMPLYSVPSLGKRL